MSSDKVTILLTSGKVKKEAKITVIPAPLTMKMNKMNEIN